VSVLLKSFKTKRKQTPMNIEPIGQFLKSLSHRCSELDQKWIQRSRKLNTYALLQILMQQVAMPGNQSAKAAWMRILAGGGQVRSISASAICQARQRMHWSFLREIFYFARNSYSRNMPAALWRGRRIFAIDSTRLHLPASCRGKKYIHPSKTSYYPQALLTVLYQLKAGVPHGAEFCRHFDERRSAKPLLRHIEPGDVIVADRGFFLLPFSRLSWQLNRTLCCEYLSQAVESSKIFSTRKFARVSSL
jgi:hypothetical protein